MARKNKPKPKKIVARFNRYFGEDNLDNWQRLCSDIFDDSELETRDISSKTKCRKLLKSVFINIYDLLDAVESSPKKKPERFKTHAALVNYTVKTRRIFPRDKVKNELGPVRALLREIL
ncbi:hypothetical protein QBC40DRAFT_45116 [Triangularia verruculosa]|uniref:Uncharacterized protein n=1 Tax=Triangularia verruculosa TaxID=2587418 RepID=A0AAN6XPM6_9PEZI|nr:hypothetical protein QBC40DRAFT_45116 [Triangularia verruculosa]